MAAEPARPPSAEDVRVPRPAERAPRTSEVIAASIRRQIARGEFQPGDRFPSEDELMGVFGIARSTLREALRILESEGLVEVLRGRRGGPRVTRPDVDHLGRSFALLLQLDGVRVGDVYAARRVIEPELARMLAQRPDAAAVDVLRAAVDQADVAADTGDGHAFGEAATEVHEAVVESAGNATLAVIAKLLHGINARLYEYAGGLADQAQMRRAVRSYRKLVRLVEAGDADGAEAHWRRHMAFIADAGGEDLAIDLV